jgi:hypothetical protein
LAITLAPEVADAGFDGFADVVARLVGFDGENPEDDVGCAVAGHLSARYILKI